MKATKTTQWYVFYTIYEDEQGNVSYLVRYLNNNHMIAQYL
jgi:hypothetical protein